MNRKLTLLAIAAATAMLGQSAFAADAPKAKAKAPDCYEAGTAPAPKSDKTRAEVKKDAKGAMVECEASASPTPASSQPRAVVKAETKAAMKAGEIPKGEAMIKPTK